MSRKNLLILTGILAVVLAAVLLVMNGREAPSIRPGQTTPPRTEQTPSVQTETEPAASTAPEQTVPEETEPEQTELAGTEPEETEPQETDPRETEPEETGPIPTEPAAEEREIFPTVLEGGALTVQSLFQFTGMNPDADNQFGENIAGIELTNTSGVHMTEADVTVIMADGTVLTFRAEDVPAGRTVMAFSVDYAEVKDIRTCEEVYGYAAFEDSDLMQSDLVECTVDGIAITIRNVSGTELNDLNVICHELLDSSYFGGEPYHYHVSTLPAGASTVIYAENCFLGMVEVVRVELGG